MKLTTIIKETLFFNSTIYGLLRANLKRIVESSAGPQPNSRSNKSVERVPVPIKQRDSRSDAMVVQAGNRNNPSSAVEEFKEVSNSSSLSVQLIIHDPTELDAAWMKSSLLGVLSEGIDYQKIKQALIDNGVQVSGFRFM
ncbi:hypothetical protein H0E87_029820, partial [Populus deltoides]